MKFNFEPLEERIAPSRAMFEKWLSELSQMRAADQSNVANFAGDGGVQTVNDGQGQQDAVVPSGSGATVVTQNNAGGQQAAATSGASGPIVLTNNSGNGAIVTTSGSPPSTTVVINNNALAQATATSSVFSSAQGPIATSVGNANAIFAALLPM